MQKAISTFGMKAARIIVAVSLLVANITFINTGEVSAQADLPPDLTGIASGSDAITAGELVLMEKEVADALLGTRWRTFPSSFRNWCLNYFQTMSPDVREAMCAFYAAGQLYPGVKWEGGSVYSWDPDQVMTRYDMAMAVNKMVYFQRNYNQPVGTSGQYGMGSDTPHPVLLDLNAYTTYSPYDARITKAYYDAGQDYTNGVIGSYTAQGIQLGSLPGNRILEPCYKAAGDHANTWPDERYANPEANFDRLKGQRPPGYAYIPHLYYCGFIHQTADETRMNLSRWYCASLATTANPDGQNQGKYSGISSECWNNYWVQSGDFQRGAVVDAVGNWNMRPYIEGVPAGTYIVSETHEDEDPSDDYTGYDIDGWEPTSMSYWVGYEFNRSYYIYHDKHYSTQPPSNIVSGPYQSYGWHWAGPWYGYGTGPTVAAPASP